MNLSFFELGRDNKKNILIIHGWASSKEKFRPLAQNLIRKGWRVIAIDLPGFGESPVPNLPLTVAGYTSVVGNFIQEIFGNKPFVVFGHSFGGRIAARISKGGKGVYGLVLCAPGAGGDNSFTALLYKVIAKIFLSLPAIRRVVLNKYYGRASGFQRFILKGIRLDDPKKTFSGINVPVLILWGTNDKVVPVDKVEALRKMIRRSLVRTFPKIGHSLPYHRGARLAQEITTWSSTFGRE